MATDYAACNYVNFNCTPQYTTAIHQCILITIKLITVWRIGFEGGNGWHTNRQEAISITRPSPRGQHITNKRCTYRIYNNYRSYTYSAYYYENNQLMAYTMEWRKEVTCRNINHSRHSVTCFHYFIHNYLAMCCSAGSLLRQFAPDRHCKA